MCEYFIDLYKACPKDSFPLPKINQLVDSTACHGLMSFIDAFSGYNQICMSTTDEENITFVIDYGLHCYRVMPFGLKKCRCYISNVRKQAFQALDR